MKHIYLYISMAILLMVPCTGFALQDSYIGDTAIYGGATSAPNPNVLIVFDSSGSMGWPCANCGETNKITIAQEVISNLILTTNGVNFGVMRFNDFEGGRFITSGDYTTTIKDMDNIHTGDTTNRQALIDVVNTIQASGWTPLAETLLEAKQYFAGEASLFDTTNFPDGYTSPIMAWCQSNYIIVITDGASTEDRSVLLTDFLTDNCTNGDCDGDGNDPGTWGSNGSDYLDDVAWYLSNTDFSDDPDHTQNIKTFTVAFDLDDTAAVTLLQDTADNGQGNFFEATDAAELSAALASILIEVQKEDTAFVAPVVPTSPENKVYSGERIYLGFFKPITNGTWIGNLKKYGLSENGEVLDKNGDVATAADGSFLDTSISYWGDSADEGYVDAGGVGAVLRDMDARKIYTYTGTNPLLNDPTNPTNLFSTSNVILTPDLFGLTVDDVVGKDQVINYIYGLDAYDEEDATEKRAWIMGDILHSKPIIQSYNNYIFTEANESNQSINKTVIFVGSNDGQLHAFNDWNGAELWSFIPPQALPYLKNLNNNDVHEYFMDGSPTMYVYDYDQDGNIGSGPETAGGDGDPTNMTNTGDKDKVIMIVSMRRGGGIDTLHATESRGYYYALDVTNPETPVFLWSLDSSTLGELGETWSDPVIGKVRLNDIDRVVAFIGAGYDNNEDLRFGDTQGFPDTTDATTSTIAATSDAGDVTSSGNDTQFNPRGRGIYVIELATLNSDGVPTVHTTPQKLWEYVYSSDPNIHGVNNNPTFSFPTEIAPLDYDFDGYIDRLYAGDTGGNMWRFDISAKDSTDYWSGTKVFSANPSKVPNSDEDPVTNGRKIFHRPSIVQEPGYVGVYFGTGDRAHPLNEAVVDRLYAFYDRNGATTPKTEEHLVNVTEDILQKEDTGIEDINAKLEELYSVNKAGWFIKLNEDDGEKVLANPLVFNKVAYFTTFTPDIVTDDPCAAGNLGKGRIYALNYKTGEAVFNFDLTNDVNNNENYATGENARAKGRGDGEILRRSDRFKVLGPGIPSGVVVVVRSDGTSSALVGCGGGLCGGETKGGGTIIPLYWIME